MAYLKPIHDARMARIHRRMTTVTQALSAAFRRQNIKSAFRSVTFHWKQYLCFFLALLLIEVGFGVISLCTDAELSHAQRQIRENYNYHYEITGLNNDQMSNLNNAFFIAMQKEVPYLKNVWYTQEGDDSYTFYVEAPDHGKPEETRRLMQKELLSQIPSGYEVRESPLVTYPTAYRSPYLAFFSGGMLLWWFLSVLMLVVLYLIRLDHFHFTYGVYITCGADFPMLFGTSAGELLAIAVLCFLPAMLLGYGVTMLLCITRGVALSFSARTALLVPLGTLMVVLASAYVPMRRLARQMPLRLLKMKDSSGLVTSPRRSFHIFGARFPQKYELYTFWRMRKYYVRLVLSAVLFASLFVCGLYIAEMQSFRAQRPAYEYMITYAPTFSMEVETDRDGAALSRDISPEDAERIRTDADLFLDEVQDIPGVDYVYWDVSVAGGYSLSHLLLKQEQIKSAGAHTVLSEERASDGYRYAIQNYNYTAVDQNYLDVLLSNQLCTVEGDPYAVLTSQRQVILTENVYNQQAYRFSPGDKIVVARFSHAKSVPMVTADEKALLREQIRCYDFTYVEYTVCAVLRGLPSEYNITFGVNYDEYAALSGEPAVREALTVYMQPGTDMQTVRAAEGKIRRALSYFSGWEVDHTGHYFESNVWSTRNDAGVSRVLAVLLLLVSPLVWLFSQILFYRKRRGELHMLHALGAPDGSFPRIYRLAGGVLSGVAFLATVGIVSLCNWLVYELVAVLLPKMHITEAFPYAYRLSIPALLSCAVISVVCGFLSCEVPYRLFRREPYTPAHDE